MMSAQPRFERARKMPSAYPIETEATRVAIYDWTPGNPGEIYLIGGENLTNNSADTFAFGNPYRVRASAQRTPLKPRTFGLNVRRDF